MKKTNFTNAGLGYGLRHCGTCSRSVALKPGL